MRANWIPRAAVVREAIEGTLWARATTGSRYAFRLGQNTNKRNRKSAMRRRRLCHVFPWLFDSRLRPSSPYSGWHRRLRKTIYRYDAFRLFASDSELKFTEVPDLPSPGAPATSRSSAEMKRILYLHGFASGPSSARRNISGSVLEGAGFSVTIPDLAEGDFESLTLSGQLEVISPRRGGRDPVTLIGSSMGGYLAALYAARHTDWSA